MKTVYNAERAQAVHDLNASVKGPQIKIDKNSKIEEYIRKLPDKTQDSVIAVINLNYSSDA